jgi:hypothetical protein
MYGPGLGASFGRLVDPLFSGRRRDRRGEKAPSCHKGLGSHIRRQLCRGCQGQRHQVHRFRLRWHRSLQLSCVLQRHGRRPAAGCKKALRITYVCGKNTKNSETCALEAEAGKGGDDGEPNNFCLLHCLSEGSRERRKAKSKEEKTPSSHIRPVLQDKGPYQFRLAHLKGRM